ncbi:MAG: D-2-hydroxyacid dehydrogenase [Chloroflexota bacterium]|nr:MAG: D-2-hydroxyacid dehydrogenase [Chloroflexota bacterium]
MNSPKEIIISFHLPTELLHQIQAASEKLKIHHFVALKTDDIPQEAWQKVEILFTHKVVPSPDLAPKLRWIQFYRAGNEQFMDEPILDKPDLIATTMSGASAPQVAEYALEMILALGHRLPQILEDQKGGVWRADRLEYYAPLELSQSTVGIVGYGSIGREIARLLNHFGTVVLATKQNAMHPADPGYTIEGLGDPDGDYFHRLYPAEALQSMVKECDFVVVSLPLTKNSQDLIDHKHFEAMKPTAFLIDVSRGGIINHEDLKVALMDGKIAGAALDVFPEEPLPEDDPLWNLPNVILTPHIAGVSRLYNQRAVDLFLENLNRYLEGKDLYNLIDLHRGY